MKGEKERIKVTHITTVHNLFDTRIFYKECKSLSENNFTVNFIVPYNKKDIKEINNIKIIPILYNKNRFIRFFLTNFGAFINALKLNSQIYHFHDPEFIPFAYLIKIIKRKKVIYDIHEDYVKGILLKSWIPTNFLRKITSIFFDKIEKFFSHRFDALILAESYYLNRFKNINNNIEIVLNYPIIECELNNQVKIKKESINFIYTGTISKKRGIWEILNIFINLIKIRKDLRLYLIGKFYDIRLYNNFMKYIEENNLNNYVAIIGGVNFVKRFEIDSYYKYMDIGFILYHYEPFYETKIPTKFYEYMLNEIPIIATDFPIWKEFLDENRCGLTVNLKNLEDTTDNIIKLIEDENLRNEMGKNGKENVIKKYNWNNEAKKLINLYKRIIK